MHHREAPRPSVPAPTAAATPANPIRVVVVDDKLIVREGMCALLARQPGFDVVGQAASVGEALLLDARPDVVVTDLALPDARGVGVIAALHSHFAHAAIFVLVDDERSLHMEQPVADGARGYASKTASADDFLTGLRTVAQGVHYVHPSLRTDLAAQSAALNGSAGPAARPATAGSDMRAINSLTEKEREVLRYLVLGHTNAEIATLCTVSLRTVEARRARVLQKLGVRTRAELVRVAQHVGGIDIDRA